MIFPAIDLRAGQSVRLYQGDFEQATLINADPVAQAKQINAAGLNQLHLVDLDGAKAGQPENYATIAAIRAAFNGTLELGGDRIVIGIDGKQGYVAINGWLDQSQTKMSTLMQAMQADGAKHFIVTDVARDGTLQGPNIELYQELQAQLPAINLIASGGVRNLEDVQMLQASGFKDVIIGKALAAGNVTLAELAEVAPC
ncbi:HisA/HisF-related TIM barrel protein [Lactiplantibacillus herbarum]|uniref:1-(5-phosphoribosyl)-5-[(5- phosphoribosylamino)methylideneamino]imidazole-4- carboxamide isomerase n=1 Tax=Lactiplantibacillus herbarum TaxID=1670446 RepID=UPI00064E55FB|nr:1-(5-phosphoribosyl)-5-[(5-phosphoribosylamino)methylideneamino] imidazole-4-carboxamide isomerase [Lactiplantibacillus herbarum]